MGSTIDSQIVNESWLAIHLQRDQWGPRLMKPMRVYLPADFALILSATKDFPVFAAAVDTQ